MNPPISNGEVAPMLWWITETTVVAAVLAAVAALAPRMWSLGPATRHALWLIVLIKLMAPPLVSWPWPVFTRPPGLPATSAPPGAAPGVGGDRHRTEVVAMVASRATADVGDRRRRAPLSSDLWLRSQASALRRGLLLAWLAVAAGLAAGQVLRIIKFRRRVRDAVPAPPWLVEETERLGQRLRVVCPEVLAAPGLGVPLLWCLGRPRLLLPARLIGTVGAGRWRGILAHELAHLRRGDHWVRRFALVTGWVWWWNPLYWIARRRIDAEAELACDAWVMWALPEDRIAYAETLVDICESFSMSRTSPLALAPALGVTSSGRLLERRLTMILRDDVPCRLSLAGGFGAGLLVLLGLPAWTIAEPARGPDRPVTPHDPVALAVQPKPAGVGVAALANDDDDDADPDTPAPAKKAPRPKVFKPRKSETDPTAPGAGKIKIEIDLSDLEKVLGPDSPLVKDLEKLGPEIEKAMMQKFGPGSEFETKMKELGQRMEKKLGPGSEFEQKMKELSVRLEKKFGGDSEFAQKLKEKTKEEKPDELPVTKKEKLQKQALPGATLSPALRLDRSSREARIKDLESRVDKLMLELKMLKAEDRDDEDKPRGRDQKSP
jgi:beta-lactamase regulating signal transducer with metallopeptidase domain